MGYNSPITIMQNQIRMELENGIYKAVQKVDIEVDKDELIKALRYDREQYDKGYKDGCKKTAREIFDTIIKALEERKERIKAFYGVAESSGADIAIRTVKVLAEQYGVEIGEEVWKAVFQVGEKTIKVR